MRAERFYLYRLRNKTTLHEAFNTWFKSAKLAFAPLKAKHKKYKKYGHSFANNYDPEFYEAVEYEIKPVRTIEVNQE